MRRACWHLGPDGRAADSQVRHLRVEVSSRDVEFAPARRVRRGYMPWARSWPEMSPRWDLQSRCLLIRQTVAAAQRMGRRGCCWSGLVVVVVGRGSEDFGCWIRRWRRSRAFGRDRSLLLVVAGVMLDQARLGRRPGWWEARDGCH